MIDNDRLEQLLNQYQTGCVFCAPSQELVLGQTPNFGVCFDVAPLTPGHLILYSIEHHACAGEVPHELFPELLMIKRTVADTLRSAYGAVTFYEHGRAGHCLTDGPEHRLCHHFHLHCVPIGVDIAHGLARRFTSLDGIEYDQIVELYEQYGDYLYVESDGGKGVYFVVDRPIERHLLRTLISDSTGHPERADWKSYASRTPLVEGMATLRDTALAGQLLAANGEQVQA